MKYILLTLVTLLAVSCSKEIFPDEHSDESVSVMLLNHQGNGFGTTIATFRGDREFASSGSALEFKGYIAFSIKSASNNSFELAYSISLQDNKKRNSPLTGDVVVNYNETKFVELGDGYKLRIISHEGDIDPNELK